MYQKINCKSGYLVYWLRWGSVVICGLLVQLSPVSPEAIENVHNT